MRELAESVGRWLLAFSPVIRDLAVAIGALVTAVVAARGLRTWHDKIRGEKAFHLAADVLRSAYALPPVISRFRSGEPEKFEVIEALRELEFVPPARDAEAADVMGKAFAYARRWEPVDEAFAELEASLREARVFLGSPVEAVSRELAALRLALDSAQMIYLIHHEHEAALTPADRDVLIAPREGDTYKERVISLIGEIENLMRPHMDPRSV